MVRRGAPAAVGSAVTCRTLDALEVCTPTRRGIARTMDSSDTPATPEAQATGRAEQPARHGDESRAGRVGRQDDAMTSDRPVEDEERKVARVPLTLAAVMGAFVVVAAIVILLMWAL